MKNALNICPHDDFWAVIKNKTKHKIKGVQKNGAVEKAKILLNNSESNQQNEKESDKGDNIFQNYIW